MFNMTKFKIHDEVKADSKALFEIIKLLIIWVFYLWLIGYLVFFGFLSPPSTQSGKILVAFAATFFIGLILGHPLINQLRAHVKKFRGEDLTKINLEGDSLFLFLKKTSHEFSPEIFDQLSQWSRTTEEKSKNKFFSEITKLLDSEISGLKINQLSGIEKPLHTKERQTLLIIIAALAKEAKLDVEKASKTAILISRATQNLGAYVSENAISDKLKQIPDALESRSKDAVEAC